MTNETKPFCVTVARLANENDLSGVALVARFIDSKLQKTIMFCITCLLPGNNCNLLTISEKNKTGVSLKSFFKMGISSSRLKNPLHWNNYLVSCSCHYDLVFYHHL